MKLCLYLKYIFETSINKYTIVYNEPLFLYWLWIRYLFLFYIPVREQTIVAILSCMATAVVGIVIFMIGELTGFIWIFQIHNIHFAINQILYELERNQRYSSPVWYSHGITSVQTSAKPSFIWFCRCACFVRKRNSRYAFGDW